MVSECFLNYILDSLYRSVVLNGIESTAGSC